MRWEHPFNADEKHLFQHLHLWLSGFLILHTSDHIVKLTLDSMCDPNYEKRIKKNMIIIIAVFRANYIVPKPRHIISSTLCFFFTDINKQRSVSYPSFAKARTTRTRRTILFIAAEIHRF